MDSSTFDPSWISFAGILIDIGAASYLIKDWELQQKDYKYWARERVQKRQSTTEHLNNKWEVLSGENRAQAPNFEKLSPSKVVELQKSLPKPNEDPEIISDKKSEFKSRYGIGFKMSDYQDIEQNLNTLLSTTDVKTYRSAVKSDNFWIASRLLIFGLVLQGIGTFGNIQPASTEFTPNIEDYQRLESLSGTAR